MNDMPPFIAAWISGVDLSEAITECSPQELKESRCRLRGVLTIGMEGVEFPAPWDGCVYKRLDLQMGVDMDPDTLWEPEYFKGMVCEDCGCEFEDRGGMTFIKLGDGSQMVLAPSKYKGEGGVDGY